MYNASFVTCTYFLLIALINYPLSRPTAVASYLKDLKVHDVIQLALRVVGEGCIECRGGFLGGRCFGIYIYIGVCCSNVDVNLNSGLTTRAIQTHEILYSALRLREKKKRKKRKISGTKDFWRTKKTYEKTPTIGTFKEKIRYVCFDSFFAFLQPR